MNMELFSALIIGLAGSFHCAGMCGPIALSVSGGAPRELGFLLRKITYNFGRIITYSALGLLFGFIGDRIRLFGLQQWLSVFVGSLIILSVFIYYMRYKSPVSGKLYRFMSPFFSRAIRYLKGKNSYSSMLLIGMLNGLLPCGFIYLGLGGAIATGDAFSGAAYMALFGLGTVPVMLGVTMFGNFISGKLRAGIGRLAPVLMLVLGTLFVLRGLNLGIPYVSPKDSVNPAVMNHDPQCR